MIRIGRYDPYDKWDIVCRSWAGEDIDVGLNRLGNPSLPIWRLEAVLGGSRACKGYVRLKCEALAAGCAGTGDLDGELRVLIGELGEDGLQARVRALVDSIQLSGPDACSSDLPPRLTARLKEEFKSGALVSLRYTEEVGEIPDIDNVRLKRRPFPTQILKGKRDVLDLFCAYQYGVHDVIHVYDARPDEVTLVDATPETLDVVRRIAEERKRFRNAVMQEEKRLAEEKMRLRDAYLVGLARRIPAVDPQDLMGKIDSLISDEGQSLDYGSYLLGLLQERLLSRFRKAKT